MEAVLLAAGEGARMHPLTYTRPKVMLPIANKPILEHLLMELKEAGITRFLMVVGYHGEIVRSYFGNGERWGVTIEYITQMQQTGTASAVKRAEERVGERFLVVNGDIVARAEDIRQLMKTGDMSLLLTEVSNPVDMGVVEIGGGKVKQIQEKALKPSSRLANAGVYLLTADIFQAVASCPSSSRGEYDLTDAIQCLIDAGNEVRYCTTDYWLNLDYPWELLEANQHCLDERCLSDGEAVNRGEVEQNVTIKGKVSIGKGTCVKAGSYIEGPVVIGDECTIGPLCHLRPGTAIGNNCLIDSMVEIKNSIIMNDARLASHDFVADSVIGEGCYLGAGTRIANSRLDGKNIKMAGMDTGRRELGAVIGDRVNTGVNASIDAGTLIGNNCIIGPGALAGGVILPNSVIL